jgi:hypothetical protein
VKPTCRCYLFLSQQTDPGHRPGRGSFMSKEEIHAFNTRNTAGVSPTSRASRPPAPPRMPGCTPARTPKSELFPLAVTLLRQGHLLRERPARGGATNSAHTPGGRGGPGVAARLCRLAARVGIHPHRGYGHRLGGREGHLGHHQQQGLPAVDNPAQKYPGRLCRRRLRAQASLGRYPARRRAR